MVLGAGCAAVLLILFAGVVATLMQPYLKFAGGVALFWVAIKLVNPQHQDAEDTPEAVEDLWRAVRVVVIANLVMSLDNVVAVATTFCWRSAWRSASPSSSRAAHSSSPSLNGFRS